jgi:hypothetical protein
MCDFRSPDLFTNLKIGSILIKKPEFWGAISYGNLNYSGFLPGIYQISCTGMFYAYTDGIDWYSIDQNMEGKLIGNS